MIHSPFPQPPVLANGLHHKSKFLADTLLPTLRSRLINHKTNKTMAPKTIGLAISATALLSSPTPAQDTDPGRVPPTVVTIEQLQLGGEWRGHHGIHMTFSLLSPDKIERSDENGRLILSFNSGWKIAGVETVLIVSLADLRKCLDEGFLGIQ